MSRRDDIAERIATSVLRRLIGRKHLEVTDEAAVRAIVRRVLVENLAAEERLDAEARQLLLDHAKMIRESSADYRQLLGKVRQKLARERGFVL